MLSPIIKREPMSEEELKVWIAMIETMRPFLPKWQQYISDGCMEAMREAVRTHDASLAVVSDAVASLMMIYNNDKEYGTSATQFVSDSLNEILGTPLMP